MNALKKELAFCFDQKASFFVVDLATSNPFRISAVLKLPRPFLSSSERKTRIDYWISSLKLGSGFLL